MVWIVSMLAHCEFGAGARPVLFLHGLFAQGEDLQPFARRVVEGQDDVRVLLPDLLGHGTSPPLPAGASLETVARALIIWLDGLTISGRVPVVAHSMGGRVALRCAEVAPDRFGPFAMLDTPPGNLQARRSPLSPFIKAMCAAPPEAPTVEALLEPFRRVMMGAPLRAWIRSRTVQRGDVFTWDFDRQALADYRWTTMGEDLWSIVGRLGPESLAVFAPEVSSYVRPEDRERYAEHGVLVRTQARAKHDMHHDLPAEFVRALRAAIGLSPSAH